MVSRKVIRADNFPDANSIILIIAMMYDGDLMRVPCYLIVAGDLVTSPAQAYTAATACFMYTRGRCDMRGLKYDGIGSNQPSLLSGLYRILHNLILPTCPVVQPPPPPLTPNTTSAGHVPPAYVFPTLLFILLC